MKTNHKTRRGFTLVELLVVIVIIAALAGLTAPMVIRQRKKADQTEAVSNARQIGLAMIEIENEYGNYPDSTTAPTVTAATGSLLTLTGTNSNDYFRQLLAGNFTQSETIFYEKIANAKKPDNNISGAEALKEGEVGFGYICLALAILSGLLFSDISKLQINYRTLSDKYDLLRFDFKKIQDQNIKLKKDLEASTAQISSLENEKQEIKQKLETTKTNFERISKKRNRKCIKTQILKYLLTSS